MNRTTLTRNNVAEYVGYVIKWGAPGAKENYPYGGVAFVKGVNKKSLRIIAQTIEGDDLSHAFLVEGYNEYFFGDADRCIDVLPLQNKGSYNNTHKRNVRDY